MTESAPQAGAAFALLLPGRPHRVAQEQAERAVRMSPACSSAQASLATVPRTNTRPAYNRRPNPGAAQANPLEQTRRLT